MGSYDAIADWYDQILRGGSPVHALAVPALLELMGSLEGLDVCDLACGQGIVAREMARRGAQVTGIDLSARLLAIAQRNEEETSLGVHYQWGDAQSLREISDNSFDGVVCNLALMDIPDLSASLQTVGRILKPQGWFVFAITHPCFQIPDSRWTGKTGGTVKRELRGYFKEGPWRSDNLQGVRGQVGAEHRMLSTYLNSLIEAGFQLAQTREPQAQEEIAGRVPGYREVPAVLAVRCISSRKAFQ
jgi:ubiquinone/menaquinone biosynthesis C-methylase UbiE